MKFQKVEGQFQDKKNRDQFDFFFLNLGINLKVLKNYRG
jgi:hypothetical protein